MTLLRQTKRPYLTRLAAWCVALAWIAVPRLSALAHEKWFVEPAPFPLEVHVGRTALGVGAAAVAVAGAFLVDRLWRRIRPTPVTPADIARSREDLRRLFAWIPLILAVHIAVPLLVAGVQRQLFVPNLPLPRTLPGGVLALLEIVVAIAFLYGAFTRAAAAALALLFPAGMVFFGVADILEHLEILGIAVFLYIFGRGPYALDAIFGTAWRPHSRWIPVAIPTLRVLTGAAILWLGFTEKLWNEQLALTFLQRHPFNFMPALGFPNFSDADFVLATGLVEVAVGAVIASGLAPRLIILLAWVPFNLTLPFLGWRELVGHLPMYGIMGILLLWGGGRNVAPLAGEIEESVGGSHPRRRRRRRQ